jgi:hypothetical protein
MKLALVLGYQQPERLLVAALDALDELLIDFTIAHGILVLPDIQNSKTRIISDRPRTQLKSKTLKRQGQLEIVQATRGAVGRHRFPVAY